MLDVPAIRARFPALARQQNGRPVLFFDNPAGTQVPLETIDGFARYLQHHNANTGGEFAASRATDRLIDDARQGMADFLGAAGPDEIIFGQNMTALTFQLSHALARVLRPGDEVVTTRLEHDANISPWLALRERGITVRWIDINPEDATLDLESAERALTDRTRLVAVGYASNAFGTVNDVRRITEMAHAEGAWVFVDAVHYGPHGPVDVQAIGCDLLACSPYKFFGPHLGVLYGRCDLLTALPADHVRPSGDTPPYSWETGTLSHESLSALLGTLSYLRSLAPPEAKGSGRLHTAMNRIRQYERTLSERLIGGLSSLTGVRVYGITDPAAFDCRVPTASFLVEGRAPREVAAQLGEQGIYSWFGNHYAPEPMRRLSLEGTQRVGLVHYNTPQEVDRFLESLEAIIRSSSGHS